MKKEKEIEFMVRLKGKQAKYLSDFVEQGYYTTKSEVVRAGILELAHKHKVEEEKLEMELLGKAIERDMEEIKQGKSKLYSEKEFQKKFSYLKKWVALVYKIQYDEKFFKSLEQLPKELQELFYKKIEKIKREELSRKHLQYGCPYFTEKITTSARLTYKINKDLLIFNRCFANHKEYERWLKNEK